MKMKKSKVLLTLMCAVALVVTSVFGTLAYLTSTDEVVNTFTVGKVVITLDEQDVDDSDNDKNTTERDKANAYHLLPGHEYVKDPTVHVDANSESCYVFVKVENGIANIEAEGNNTIAKQIVAKGWTALDGQTGVYYKTWTKGSANTDLVVFEKFQIAGTATNDTIKAYLDKEIKVTAYAIQMDGIDDAATAWGKF